ncbi:hypothetical protein [Clostridium beijerinckii]|uniref:hypothetical protein n=1 Tax=Clostridium beijerinckii TaxID=1520 RepID=UPI00156F9C4D|nr:hypothetical protein [Clostridium beijerinckii]NRT73824.1 hypothetical protein [Clostridium beijerinckii]
MKKETTQKQSTKITFIDLAIMFIIALPVILFISNFYYKFQNTMFSNADELLFVHDSLSLIIICFSPGIILFCIILHIRINTSIKIMRVKIFLFIPIVVFIISLFVLTLQFFKYTGVSNEGISVRNGILSSSKNYTWSNVTDVEVSYELGYKHKVEIDYNIHLNDGIIVNAYNSEDFFSNIVNLDNFIKNKGIKIIRSNIKPSDYGEFDYVFHGDRMKVILSILNK